MGSTDGKILLRWGSHAIEKHYMITKHNTPSCWHTSSLESWNFMEAQSHPRKVWKVCRLIVSEQVRSTRHVGTVQVWLHWMGGRVSWKHGFSKVWLHVGTFVSSGEFIVQFPGTERKRSFFGAFWGSVTQWHYGRWDKSKPARDLNTSEDHHSLVTSASAPRKDVNTYITRGGCEKTPFRVLTFISSSDVGKKKKKLSEVTKMFWH